MIKERLVIGLLLCSIAACSSDDDTSDKGTSGTSGTSGTGGATVNGCTSFVDRTAASDSRVLAWDFAIANDATRCMEIKVGQKVAWKADAAGSANASFSTHPLTASGGDSGNPISNNPPNGEVTFSAPGTFGFACGNHGSTMRGAIRVSN
jgi:plastocyanin